MSEDPFFVAGGTVPPGSASYVERSADRELFEALLGGEFCYVLNSRQMGKSSLAVRTIAKLNGAGVRTAFVDLTRLGATGADPERWYAGLLVETGRALGLRSEAMAYLKANTAIPAVARLFGFLRDVALASSPLQDEPYGEGQLPLTPNPSPPEGLGEARRIVLMIDEIDAVRSLPFAPDDLFAGLRELWNGRATDPALGRLTVCLLGAALPGDLIADPRRTPFNVGRRIELRDFTPEEAAPFGAVVGEAALARVLHWTGGHPFLTQAVCAGLAGSPTPGPSPLTSHKGEGRVDALVRARYLDARARDADTNLADVGNRLLGTGDPNVTDESRAAVLTLYERMLRGKDVPDDEANPAAARIKMSGVARVEGGRLRVRNRIYREAFGPGWVRESMPGGELRRQRKAFWRGALRTGLVSAAVVAVVSGLAVVAAGNARQARIAQRAADRERGVAQVQATEAQRQKGLAQAQAVEARSQRDAATKAKNAEAQASGKLRVALTAQERLRREAQAQALLAQRNAAEATRQRGRAEAQTRLVTRSNAALQGELYTTNVGAIQAVWDKGDRTVVDRLVKATTAYPERGWDWAYWRRATAVAFTGPKLSSYSTDIEPVGDGRTLLAYGQSGINGRIVDDATIIEAGTGRPVRSAWSSHGPGSGFADLAFSGNGRWASRTEAGRMTLYDLVRGTSRLLDLPDAADYEAISDDGTRLITTVHPPSRDVVSKEPWNLTVRDGRTGGALASFTYVRPIVGFRRISSDGRRALLSVRDESSHRAGVAEVDLADGRVLGTYTLPVPPEIRLGASLTISGLFLPPERAIREWRSRLGGRSPVSPRGRRIRESPFGSPRTWIKRPGKSNCRRRPTVGGCSFRVTSPRKSGIWRAGGSRTASPLGGPASLQTEHGSTCSAKARGRSTGRRTRPFAT